LADTFSNSNDHDNRGTYIYLLHGVKKINLKIIDDGEDFESSFENVDEKIITCVCIAHCECMPDYVTRV